MSRKYQNKESLSFTEVMATCQLSALKENKISKNTSYFSTIW